MQLSLTHEMRINLIAIMDQQPCKITTARAIWALQDRMRIDKDEAEALGYKEILVQGAKQPVWDATKTVPAKEYLMTDQEVALIKQAINDMDIRPSYRSWLEPLMAELDSEPEKSRPAVVARRR